VRPIPRPDRRDVLLAEVWIGAAVAVAGWLILVGLALVALSAVTQHQQQAPPVAPRALDVIDPDVPAIQSRPPFTGVEITP
jgi:hypothetical protein